MNAPWTVSALNGYIKSKLESDGYLANVTLEGEISNFTAHAKGHWYFTVKDDRSKLSGVMFASYAMRNAYRPQNGANVRIRGRVSVYEAGGQYQIYATSIQEAGIGDLYQEFEKRKKMLAEKGYFDARYKKPLPSYPMSIGVVCGKETAALQDVRTTLQRRWPAATLHEFYCLVQGDQAQYEIADTLKQADRQQLDVILLVRGGGSMEDLWAFNELLVVKTVFEMQTPIITGVGHEVDVTLVDYVSDQRAATPTAAAELATPNQNEVAELLLSYRNRMLRHLTRTMEQAQSHLLLSEQRLEHYRERMGKKRQEIVFYQKRLYLAQRRLTQTHRAWIQTKQEQMHRLMRQKDKDAKQQLTSYLQLLDAYSPLKVLQRGYAIATADRKTLTSVDARQIGDDIDVRLQDGTLYCRVIGKETVK